ncbi:NACHT domain-containing protein [Streptomyces sp. NPDC060028]|uniref:NACHT domain-containing protein n=1 Tax=Streptomyces sp. NPDC060028 TaxID=3347041 RepID=UPI00369DA09D
MTGFETVLLRVAGTAAGALAKSLLGRTPGAGLAPDPVAPAARWRRPAELGDPEIRRLAQTLATRLGEAATRLPEHERLAAVDAVGDAFAALGTLDAHSLFAADLDPTALAAAALAHTPPAGLSAGAEAAYRELVALCCEHAVEYATTLPGFGARAGVELIRRTGELKRSQDDIRARLGPPAGSAAHAFEERYAEYVARQHGRLRLFGLTVSRARQEWPLDLAYISLAVSGNLIREETGLTGPGQAATVKTEQALAGVDRMLLRGQAGSGKSTLLQWLAVNAAARSFEPELSSWNTLVPFVLRMRSFSSSDSLPRPEEFLRASRVPLTAPPGWAEDLMISGRALVLVDGVDEVPQRMRALTEEWLRSLVSAFPEARYVVTTRPPAVPEDWLFSQGFTPCSLLPMEREDLSAFISRWHDAARSEADPGTDADEIGRYETALLKAVRGRRDLTRLGTNPLMCALLCALNRDRRMYLPRARKELYEAGLDMLLVRRDTEREIADSIHSTRDEQIVLLQRLAYWMIRNDRLEVTRGEAVDLLHEWLAAMPHVAVQGGADRMLQHLLIRSGLLREPAKGTVDFVHRTFQDFLAAKAAVEARDFGLLVRHAHEDTWEDVVRMAVGHARFDERNRLLDRLLKRADASPGHHHRLVMLAATSLEHAPELAPAVWSRIKDRTAELLPPKSLSQAEELAQAGELVLELLPEPAGLTEMEAASTIRTAALVGGPRALDLVAAFREDTRFSVCHELSGSWRRFDAVEYVEALLADCTLGPAAFLQVYTAQQLALLPRLRHLDRIRLEGEFGVPREILGHREVKRLFFSGNSRLGDLSALAALEHLALLGLDDCRTVSLDGLRGLPLETLYLYRLPDALDLSPLSDLPALAHLGLDFEPAPGIDRVADLPVSSPLQGLGLYKGARRIRLEGMEEWTGLDWLTLSGDAQAAELEQMAPPPRLRTLQLSDQSALDLNALVRHQGITDLYLSTSTLATGLEPLRELPALTQLSIHQCGPGIDLGPLGDLEQLRVSFSGSTQVLGTGAFPPGRLRLGA